MFTHTACTNSSHYPFVSAETEALLVPFKRRGGTKAKDRAAVLPHTWCDDVSPTYTVDSVGSTVGTVRVFRQKPTLEDVIGFPTPARRLKRLHACDQRHSSRVSTASYLKSCRNTEGTASQEEFGTVFLFPEGKLAFCGIPKVATTGWLKFRRYVSGAARCALSGQKFALEGAIGTHACSLEANMRVTNGIPLGSPLLLPVCPVNSVQTLKADYLSLPHYKSDKQPFLMHTLATEKQLEILMDPTWKKLIVIRNPAERLLSAFLDKIATDKNSAKTFSLDHRPSFSEFVELLTRPGVLFRTAIYTRGCHWIPRMHVRLQLLHMRLTNGVHCSLLSLPSNVNYVETLKGTVHASKTTQTKTAGG
jgi:hypothetical protein